MKKLLFSAAAAALIVLAACGGDSESERDSGTDEDSGAGGDIDTIVFADAGWDSIRIHNSIAQMIIEEGYGYDTDVTAGSTAATIQGLRDGDINAYTEVWTDNIREVHEEAVEAGDYEVVSTNFDDNEQGLYVPTYVIEGDSERGIEPMAPDLRTVEDLKDYPEVFEDPEDPGRGRVINAPSGWAVADAIDDKFEAYGLDETLNNFMPGSDAAIVADLASAYDSGEAWVGYYWSPTWPTAEYDLTLLEEDPYDEEIWNDTRATEFPPNDVVVAVHKDLPDQAPEVVEFLSNYETSTELTEEALIYMDENDASADEAAIWWMNEHEEIWTSWVPEEIAEDVKDALQ
jgi:glycine betaine/proline transport system substrate-binding protein